MNRATARIAIALTLSAIAALAVLPLASRDPAPAKAVPQKCTGVLAPGASC